MDRRTKNLNAGIVSSILTTVKELSIYYSICQPRWLILQLWNARRKGTLQRHTTINSSIHLFCSRRQLFSSFFPAELHDSPLLPTQTTPPNARCRYRRIHLSLFPCMVPTCLHLTFIDTTTGRRQFMALGWPILHMVLMFTSDLFDRGPPLFHIEHDTAWVTRHRCVYHPEKCTASCFIKSCVRLQVYPQMTGFLLKKVWGSHRLPRLRVLGKNSRIEAHLFFFHC